MTQQWTYIFHIIFFYEAQVWLPGREIEGEMLRPNKTKCMNRCCFQSAIQCLSARCSWDVPTCSAICIKPVQQNTAIRFGMKMKPINAYYIINTASLNDVNNQQDATPFSFINLFKSAQHVSGDKFAHPQEHLWLYIQLLVQCTASAADRCHGSDGTDVQKYSWGRANLSPETCWADLKRLINEKVVPSCWLFTSLRLVFII